MLFRLLGNGYSKIVLISGLNSIFNFLLNFLIPINLGLDFYGDYKYINIIIAFSGVFHLGYLDGFYLNSLKNNLQLKLSASYLLIIVISIFFLFASISFVLEYDVTIPFLVILILVINNTFINAFSIVNYINGSFVFPVLIQTFCSFIFLFFVTYHHAVHFFTTHLYHLIIGVSVIQLFLLFLFTKSLFGLELISIKLYPLKTTLSLHSKGLKTLSIGILGVFLLGFDKILLRFLLSEVSYGLFCFSNSFLITLVGLSMSMVNKLIKDFSKLNSLPELYSINTIIKRISIFSCCLTLLTFFLDYIIVHYFPIYKNLIEFLKVSILSFPYLFVILLVHSNLSKILNFEIHYTLYYLIVGIIQSIVILFLFDNLVTMQLMVSIIFLFSIFIFNRISVNYMEKSYFTVLNKIQLSSPVILYLLLQHFLNK